MNHLPSDAKARKNVPLYSGLIRYFPKALAEVAELSRIGNEQHNPGSPLHWDRSKSGDELDALTRHLFEAGTRDCDKVRHSIKVAWRALANAEKEIEREEEKARDPQVQHMEDHPAHPGHHEHLFIMPYHPNGHDGRDIISDENAYDVIHTHYEAMQRVVDEYNYEQEYVTDPKTGAVKGKRYE